MITQIMQIFEEMHAVTLLSDQAHFLSDDKKDEKLILANIS